MTFSKHSSNIGFSLGRLSRAGVSKVMARLVICAVLVTHLVPSVSLAEKSGMNPSLLESTSVKTDKYSRAEEYFSEVFQGEILISVNLLGGFGRPGVYHIPKQTDVIRLFALAGGTKSDADIENILIKRRSGETERVYRMNLKEMMEKPSPKNLNLEANDVILVNAKEPIISQNTITVVSIVASVLGIVVSTVVLAKGLK